MSVVVIDPELAGLLIPLGEAEAGLLEHSLVQDGCRDPLVLWAETGLLLDGHHRHRICVARRIPFRVREVSLPSRREAIEWRLASQLARRNLSPLQASYYRGKLFDSLKRPGARTDRTSGQFGSRLSSVSDQLATRYGVPRRTLTRDAAFARGLDQLVATLGVEFRTLVLSRKARLSRREVIGLAKQSQEEIQKTISSKSEMRATGRAVAGAEPGAAPPGEDAAPPPTPDLHRAWEQADPSLRAEFIARPDVMALAARLLQGGRREAHARATH